MKVEVAVPGSQSITVRTVSVDVKQNERLPRDTAVTDRLKKREGRRIQLYHEFPSLVTSGLSFTSVQKTIIHWLADAVHPFLNSMLYLEQKD